MWLNVPQVGGTALASSSVGMIKSPKRPLPQAACAFALTATCALLLASCSNPEQFLASLRDLRGVQEQVSRVAQTSDVAVNLQNGRILTVTLGGTDVRTKPSVE